MFWITKRRVEEISFKFFYKKERQKSQKLRLATNIRLLMQNFAISFCKWKFLLHYAVQLLVVRLFYNLTGRKAKESFKKLSIISMLHGKFFSYLLLF